MVWDLEAGEQIGVLEGPVSFPRAVISADARTAVTTTAEGMLRAWDLATWEESEVGEGSIDLMHLASADLACDRCVVTAQIDVIRYWDLASYRRAVTPIGQSGIFGVWALGITPDGSRAVMAGSGEAVEVWDLAAAAYVSRFSVPHEKVKSLAITRDGANVVTVTEGSLAVSELATGALLLHIRLAGIDHVWPTEDADRVLIGGQDASGNRILAAFDTYVVEGSPVLVRADESSTILPSKDGRFAVVTDARRRATLRWLESEGRQVELGASAVMLEGVTVPPGSTRLVGVGRVDRERAGAAVWDTMTGDLLGEAVFAGDSRPLSAYDLSLDGARATVSDNGGRTHFLELRGFG